MGGVDKWNKVITKLEIDSCTKYFSETGGYCDTDISMKHRDYTNKIKH